MDYFLKMFAVMDAGHIVICLLGLLVAKESFSLERKDKERWEEREGGGNLFITQKHADTAVASFKIILYLLQNNIYYISPSSHFTPQLDIS